MVAGAGQRCEELSTQLAGLPLLDKWPSTLQPATRSSGCDGSEFTSVAEARREFNGIPDPTTVVAFYRTEAERDGWQVRVPTPPAEDQALLCATREIDGTAQHLELTQPTQWSYALQIADEPSDGYRCS